MENNNPYQRNYKSKTEQYKEKLKQRSNSQDWIFGNIFGKPGGGAPLRDNKGNIISQLKTINNGNIFKHDANYFSKGNNNISVVNNNIYNKNNLILTPNSYQNKQVPIFTPRTQSISFQDRRSNNLILQNNPNYNINSLTLNQRQMPFRYIIPLQNIIPLNQVYPFQMNNNIPNYYKHMATTPSMNNNSKIVTPSINYVNKSQNISNNNINNINKEDLKIDNSSEINNNINENEENLLLISNDNDQYNKLQNEKKLEEWKNDLKAQMEQQKKRKEEAKRKEAEKDREEELKYKEYLVYKAKQAEENKKNKSKWKKNRNQQSQNQSIEAEKSNNNELEQSQQSKNDNNINNLENNEFEEEPYSQNNPLNSYNIPPEKLKEQENLKNYIDNQYDSLGEILGQNIQGEIERLSSKLTKKYEPFSNDENLNLNGIYKFSDITAQRNNKRMEKMHDIMEERDLLDFIIGKDNQSFSTSKYQNYDTKKYYNLSSKMPSFFGKNIMPYENENKQLNSDGRFIYGDFSKNKTKETETKYIISEKYPESKYVNQNYDNYYLNNNTNRKFGKNKNENMNSQSLDFSQSLDNKSSFVPIDKNKEQSNQESKINNNFDTNSNINKNDFELNYQSKLDKLPDKVEENIIKGLNEIDKLNKNVILYNKDGSLIQNFNNDNINNTENNSEARNEIKEEINEKNVQDKIAIEKEEKGEEKQLDNNINDNKLNLNSEKEEESLENDNVSE